MDGGSIDLLRKCQARFPRHVEESCGLNRHTLEMVDVIVRLIKTDIKALRKLVLEEHSFDEFFVLLHRDSRLGLTLS